MEKHNDDSVIKLVYFPIIDYAGDSKKRFGHYDYIVVDSFAEVEVVTTAHEVGHELGLSHVSNPWDIMFGHPFIKNEILGYINLSARKNSNLKFREGSKKQWEKIKKQFQQKP